MSHIKDQTNVCFKMSSRKLLKINEIPDFHPTAGGLNRINNKINIDDHMMQNQAPNYASFPNPPIHPKPEADALPSDLRNSFYYNSNIIV